MTIASARAVLAAPDRVEGHEKVTGAAKYAYEYPHDEVAYAAIVQATIAKGAVDTVDASAALAPWAVGFTSGSMIFSCSTTEPGHP